MSRIISPLLGLGPLPVSEKTQFRGHPRPNHPNHPNLDGKTADFCGSAEEKNAGLATPSDPDYPDRPPPPPPDSGDSGRSGLGVAPFSHPESSGKQPFPSVDSGDSGDSGGGASENRIFAASASETDPPDADLDPERAAIMDEEYAPMASPAEHRAAVAALMRVALPLPGTPLHGIRDAYGCQACGRGMWVSPSWPGPAPSLCWACERGERP